MAHVSSSLFLVGLVVFLLPVCLGFLLLGLSLTLRCVRLRRPPRLRAGRLLRTVAPAAAMAASGLAVSALARTDGNYPYTHSTWHLLMAGSLLCLLPRCRRRRGRGRGGRKRERRNSLIEVEEEGGEGRMEMSVGAGGEGGGGDTPPSVSRQKICTISN